MGNIGCRRYRGWAMKAHRRVGGGNTPLAPGGCLAGEELVARLLRAVLRPSLPAVLHTGRVKRTTNNVVLYTWEVLHTTAPHEHNRVLLQVVALSGNVGRDLIPVGEADTRHLPKRRVRLLRSGRVHPGADPSALWASFQSGRVAFLLFALSPFPDELLNRRHGACCSLSNGQNGPLRGPFPSAKTACVYRQCRNTGFAFRGEEEMK